MATQVKFLQFTMSGSPGLAPTPNVSEEMEISSVLSKDETPRLSRDPEVLTGKTLKILANYRQALLHLEGGLAIVRIAPVNGRVNQYTTDPVPGTKETVTLGDWYAEVEFV